MYAFDVRVHVFTVCSSLYTLNACVFFVLLLLLLLLMHWYSLKVCEKATPTINRVGSWIRAVSGDVDDGDGDDDTCVSRCCSCVCNSAKIKTKRDVCVCR